MNNETKQHQRWKLSSWASSVFLNQPKLTVNNSDDPKATTNEPTNYDPTTIPKKKLKLKLIVDNDRFQQHNIEDEESGFGTIYVTGNNIDNDKNDIRLPAPLPIKKSFGQRFNDYIDDASTIATIQTISHHHHPRVLDIVNTPKRINRNNSSNQISPLSFNSKVFRDRTNVIGSAESYDDDNNNIKTMTMTEIREQQEDFTYSDSSIENNDNNNNIEIVNHSNENDDNNNNNIIIENTDVVRNNDKEVNFNKKQHSFSFHCCTSFFLGGINQDLKHCLPTYKGDWIVNLMIKSSLQDTTNDNNDNIMISNNNDEHDNNNKWYPNHNKLIQILIWKGFCIIIHQFIIHFMICITFSQLLYEQTSGTMGLVEILMSSCIVGIMFSIMKGNDFNHFHTINGPIIIWIGTIYNGLYTSISKEEDNNNSNFFSLFFWICIWSSIFHVICSMMRYSTIIQTSITAFTTNILQLFIGISFTYLSLYQLLQPLHILHYDNNSNSNTSSPQGNNSNELSLEYASLLLGIITMYLCWSFHFANEWNYFTKSLRIFLSSYNTLLSCIIVTSISFLPGINQQSSYNDSSGSSYDNGGIDRLTSIQAIPWNWLPTYDRSWIIRPLSSSSINQTTIGIAIVPGFILFILLHLINNNNNNKGVQQATTEITGHIATCRRKPTHHWDTFVSGMALLPCAFLGLPPSTSNNDSFQNLMMNRPSSTDHHHIKEDETIQRRSTLQNEHVLEETRWVGVVYSMFMFIGLFSFRIIAWIPQGCIYGLLLYCGVIILSDNSIWEHIKLCFMTSKARLRYQQSSSLQIAKILENVPWTAIQLYTFIQVALTLLIFVTMQFSRVGYLYPIFIISLIPIRQYILLKLFFTKGDLQYLDPKQLSSEPQLQDQIETPEEDLGEELNDDDGTTASQQLYFFDANQSHDVATLCHSEASSRISNHDNEDNNFGLYHQKHPLHPPANLFEKQPTTPRLQHSVRSSGIKKQKEMKGTSRPNNNQYDLNSILSLTQTKLSSILVGNLAASNNAAAYYSDDNGNVNSASMWSQSNVE